MEYMKLNHKRGAIPLYLQIYEILRNKIEGEAYVYGDLLPSELELEKHYHVSRITVRQAIAELEKEGYVKRARGKGTTVTYTSRINESLSEIRSFTKEMEERGRKPGTRYIDIRKTAATEEVANALGIEIGSEVYHLYRVRTADDEPIVIFETFLSNDYDFPWIRKAIKEQCIRCLKKWGQSCQHGFWKTSKRCWRINVLRNCCRCVPEVLS